MEPRLDLDAGPEADTSRSYEATVRGAQAFARLLTLAEERDSGQITRVVRFIGAVYNGHADAFDLFDLRAVDIAISDDMLQCLDALRWGHADLHALVPRGAERVQAVFRAWRLPCLHADGLPPN